MATTGFDMMGSGKRNTKRGFAIKSRASQFPLSGEMTTRQRFAGDMRRAAACVHHHFSGGNRTQVVNHQFAIHVCSGGFSPVPRRNTLSPPWLKVASSRYGRLNCFPPARLFAIFG
ncbi:hypothetical protein [Shinella zoogloeoides]